MNDDYANVLTQRWKHTSLAAKNKQTKNGRGFYYQASGWSQVLNRTSHFTVTDASEKNSVGLKITYACPFLFFPFFSLFLQSLSTLGI